MSGNSRLKTTKIIGQKNTFYRFIKGKILLQAGKQNTAIYLINHVYDDNCGNSLS